MCIFHSLGDLYHAIINNFHVRFGNIDAQIQILILDKLEDITFVCHFGKTEFVKSSTMVELKGVEASSDVSVGWNLNPIVKFFIHWNKFHNQK